MIASENADSGFRWSAKAALWGSTALSLTICMGWTTDRAFAQQIVSSGETRNLTEGEEVKYEGSSHVTAITVRSGATLNGTGAIISTSGTGPSSGELAAGIRAAGNSTVNLAGGSVAASGTRYTRGILGYDSGSSVTTDGTVISTTGDNSHAVHMFNGAAGLIQNGTISTQGSDSFGLSSQGAGTELTARDVTILTSGFNGFGAFAHQAGLLQLYGGSIKTTGDRGHGAVAVSNSSIMLDGTVIETTGNQAAGLAADQDNTSISATGVDIVTRGIHSYGVVATGGVSGPAAIVLHGGSVLTATVTGRVTQSGEGARG